VLVDLRDASLERVIDLNAKLTAAIVRPVDLVRLGDAEREPAFLAAALSNGRVLIDGGLCRRLTLAQSARSRIEHDYVGVPAGDVHRACVARA
jgi:hypothetical protein